MDNNSNAQSITTTTTTQTTPTTVINVKLQTEILTTTKDYLRIEAVRRRITMGQLIDEWVQLLCESVPETTS